MNLIILLFVKDICIYVYARYWIMFPYNGVVLLKGNVGSIKAHAMHFNLYFMEEIV